METETDSGENISAQELEKEGEENYTNADIDNLVNFNNEVEELNKNVREKEENASWAMKAKIETLEETNNKLQEENKTMNASLESYKNYVERKDKITALLSGVTCYKCNEAKAAAIESFAMSTMPIEDIDRFCARPMKAIKIR